MSDGVWVVWMQDWHRLPQAVFADELEARRWADAEGSHLDVGFWRFGTEWDELQTGADAWTVAPDLVPVSGESPKADSGGQG